MEKSFIMAMKNISVDKGIDSETDSELADFSEVSLSHNAMHVHLIVVI